MKRTMGAILAGSLVFTAPFGVFGAAVSAHATLDRSVPAAGAVLTTPPRQVDLYFGETLADPGGASFAVVLDASGRTVSGADRGDPADARHLIAPINGALDDGSYTVFWKSTSASDGGATLGDFAFNVGATAASPQPGTGGQVPVPDAMRARALTASDGGGAGGWLAGGAIGVVVGAAVTVGIVDIRARRAAAVDKRRATGRRR